MTLCFMKRVAAYILFGLVMIMVAAGVPNVLTIGGLFGAGKINNQIENTIQFAIERINRDSTLLKDTVLELNVQRLGGAPDSYQAGRKACHLLNRGVVALFGPQESQMATHVNSICNALDVPHFEARLETRSDLRKIFSINLYPEADILANAFVDLISFYRWTRILVLYGDQYGLLKLQNLLKMSNRGEMSIIVRQVNNGNMRVTLREAEMKNWHNILVDLNVDDTLSMLKIALQEGMVNSNHKYILTNLDTETIDMEDFRYNYVNLTAFRLIPREDPRVRSLLNEMSFYQATSNLILLNSTNPKIIKTEAALMYDAVYMLAYGLKEIQHSQDIRMANLSCDGEEAWSYGSSVYNYMNLLPLSTLSGTIQPLQQGRRTDFKLEILCLTEAGFELIGDWNPKDKLNFTTNFLQRGASLPNSKYGFNETLRVTSIQEKSTLVVTSLVEKPFVMLKKNHKELQGNNKYEGFCIDLLHEVAGIVGFNYEIRLVADEKYGAQDSETKEWNGMVRELIDKKADLAVASLTISYIREQVVDFTKPFMNLGISILFKVPIGETPGLFSFLNPLALEIWLYVIVAYITVSFVMFILARFSPYEWYSPDGCSNSKDTVENIFTLSNSFWFTVGTLMQQGSDINPRALSTRIVGGIWWFFTLIIISSYTANLAAFLTVERMVSPIENAEDLSRQTEIAYGTISGGSTMTFFKDSKIETYKRMWQYMDTAEPNVFVSDSLEGINRVLKGNYAYLMESVMIDYTIQRECDLMQVGGLLDSKGYGIGTQRGSEYRDRISLAILELQEKGRIQMIYNKWWKNTGTCNRDDKKESKANELGVENVGGIFVVLVAGLALAVIVAVIEFIWNSKHNAQTDRLCSKHLTLKGKKQSLCSEMAEELRFAIRCHGSTTRPAFRRQCSKCSTSAAELPVDSPNGVIQLRELRRSPMMGIREYRSPSPIPDLYARDFGRPSSPSQSCQDCRRSSNFEDFRE
ncbi:glutamate receptor ionotropic, kainate 2-like [Tubulanus polymorphus]|uniref:glutamate receptor ionotropic, kainate 2-like n=1 Tax=Tubulanus polymorphus TaxID=672921 RepID=UPI003DA4D2D7